MVISGSNKRFIVLHFFIVTHVLNSFSQDYSYINYDTRDGLAGSVVYDALQDKEGFMWFATENGLSRFDGKRFKTFTTKDGLPDNEILRLFLDSKGRLWILPFKPSVCYYYKGKIHSKNNDPLVSKINLFSHAFDMAEDKSGNLFIEEMTAWHTLFKNGMVKTVNQLNNLNIGVYTIGTNKSGEVELIVEAHSIPKQHFLIKSNEDLEIFKTRPDWLTISTSLICPEYIIIPSPGKRGPRLYFYKDTNEVFSLGVPPNTVSINYIDKNKIIINTRTGIRFFNPETKDLSGPFFKEFSFTSAFEDKENNLWLTTSGSGVLMVPSFQFRNYSYSDDKENPEISALSIIGKTVYAGGWEEKISELDMNNLKFSFGLFSIPPGAKIISILPIRNKVVLTTTGYFQNPFNAKRVPISLKSVNIGRSGIVYASHRNAFLCKWSGIEQPIWEGRSTCALEKDSGFYIGTLNGLYYESYRGNIDYLGKHFPVLSSRIVNLGVSDKGLLWVTTKGNGIAAYFNNKLLYHFTESNGLTSDNCTSLYVDGDIIWLGTDQGLNRIAVSGAAYKITRFSISDGLPSNNINAIAAVGKKVFVGTPKGLTYFEVDKISQKSACDLQLTGVYIANKYWGYDSTNFSLPHNDNDIRFEYSGISFKSAGEMKYQYRLLGLQPEWRTTSENQLNFTSLPSGKYLFQLKAINKYGVTSRVQEVSFVIQKLLWEKNWFKIMILLLLIGAIWLFFRYRISRVRLKEKEQAKLTRQMAELEQRALRSQMSPHFIFNSLNSIQQYVAERDITGANKFITDFSRLIRMTLDLSTYSLINMSDEMDYITTYLKVEKARLENQFDYCINIDKTLNLQEIYLPPLLLQPYVENSIRHGIKYRLEGGGLIQIIARKEDKGILISIEDNGIGRQAAKKYKSKYHIQYQSRGMSINEDRIKLLNSSAEKKIQLEIIDLYNSKNEATGTRVDIFLQQ
jgi:sugar lactone lactonase YvrE